MKIENLQDAKNFIVEESNYVGLSFHPDTDFSNYYYAGRNTSLYSKKRAEEMNELMLKCFDIFEKSGEDIYEFCLSIF